MNFSVQILWHAMLSRFIFIFSNIPNFQINEEDASATTSNRNITINRRPFTGTFTEDKIMNNHPRGAQLTRLPSRPRIRLRRTQTAHNLDASIKKSFEVSNKRPPENNLNMVTASDTRRNRVTSVSDTKNSPNASSKESPSRASLSQAYGMKNTSNINHGCAASSSNLSKTPENFPSSSECTDSTTNHASISIPENRHVSDQETNIPNSPLQEKQQPQNSSISTSSDLLPINRFRIGRRASTISRTEQRQREAMWDLFQSENAFLIDHLMVIKHVSSDKSFIFN